MTILNVTDASRLAGISRNTLRKQIESGVITGTAEGIPVSELIRAYPELKPLSGLKIRSVKSPFATQTQPGSTQLESAEGNKRGDSQLMPEIELLPEIDSGFKATTDIKQANETTTEVAMLAETETQAGTVELLVRELEWNKELLEQTNQLMAKQLAEQRALIADQARRLDEKDRFWARQVEIAQSLLPPPAPRKKFLGIF